MFLREIGPRLDSSNFRLTSRSPHNSLENLPKKKNRLTPESVPTFILGVMTRTGSELKTFTSGELARLAGVSTDTLRHYERKGVLSIPNRLPNGYRMYPADSLQRVLLIRRALTVGFTLEELAIFLKSRDRGHPPCRDVRAMAGNKLDEIDKRISELKTLRAELRQIIEEWDHLLLTTAPSEESGLLEFLSRRSKPAHNKPSTPGTRSFKTALRKARK